MLVITFANTGGGAAGGEDLRFCGFLPLQNLRTCSRKRYPVGLIEQPFEELGERGMGIKDERAHNMNVSILLTFFLVGTVTAGIGKIHECTPNKEVRQLFENVMRPAKIKIKRH